MEQRIKDIWYNYKSEVFFGAVLLVVTALSHWMARFIPVALFDGVITAVQNACTIAVCLFGAVLMFVHSEGIRIRKAWGWTMLIWGLADAFFSGTDLCLACSGTEYWRRCDVCLPTVSG